MKILKIGFSGLVVILFGVCLTIAQVLFIREFLVVLNGNELSIGLIYFSWFFGITIGAAVASKFSDKVKYQQFYVSLLLLFQGIIFPILIYFVRILRLIINIPPTQFIPFINLIVSIVIIVIPFSLITGMVFPLMCVWIQRVMKNERISLGTIYVLESLGSVLGGIIFNFFLVIYFNTYTIIFLILFLTALNLFLLNLKNILRSQAGAWERDKGDGAWEQDKENMSTEQHKGNGASEQNRETTNETLVLQNISIKEKKLSSYILIIIGIIIIFSFFFLMNPMRNNVEKFTINQRWKAYGEEFKLLNTINTKYQNLSLAIQEGQYSLLSNGQIMVSFPNDYEDGQFVHFFMSMHPNPKDILFIGEGNYSALKFFVQYNINKLDYVEIDPKVYDFVKKYLDKETQFVVPALAGKIHTFYTDGRLFVKRSNEKYDLIIVHLPDPSTASLNRYYTEEFFKEAQKILKDDGVFITSVSGSFNYFGKELSRYVGSVYYTLKKVFPYIVVTPEGVNNFIASMSPGVVTSNIEILAKRFESRKIQTEYFTPFHFNMLLPPNRVEYVRNYLDGLKNIPINSDMHPISYFLNLAIWNRFSGSGITGFFNIILRVKLFWFVIILLIFLILRLCFLLVKKREELRVVKFNSIFAIFTTGFVGMAFSIIMIFVFQNIYGYVYQKIGLIVAIFMIGLAIGGYVFSTKFKDDLKQLVKSLIIMEFIICLFAIILSLFFSVGNAYMRSLHSAELVWIMNEGIFYMMIFVSGFLTGGEFPLVGRVLLSCEMKLGKSAGIVNSADHLGAMCGAFITGVVLVPVLGIVQACLVLAIMKLCSFALFLLYKVNLET